MSAEWLSLCRSPDIVAANDTVEVTFDDDRRHRLRVEERADVYQLSGFVVRQARVASLENLHREAWLRNRSTTLVGFRVDERGRLVGEAWVPKAGLASAEFELYLRTLAAECDRFEFA